MTKKELSQLYYLRREIECDERRLRQLEAAADDTSVHISGLPHMQGITDRTALACEIADIKALINIKLEQCAIEYKRLMRYINTIDDSLIRQIMKLRYVDGKSWQQVANGVGGGNTANGVYQLHKRYLKKH